MTFEPSHKIQRNFKNSLVFFFPRPNYKSFSSDSCCIVFLVILSISSKNLVNFLARKHLRFEFQTCLLSFLRPGPLIRLSLSLCFCLAARRKRRPSPASILVPRTINPRIPCCPFTPPLALSLSAHGRPLLPLPKP